MSVVEPALPRIVVFGGRWYAHVDRVRAALDGVRAKLGPFVLVHGGGSGADALADGWARSQPDIVVEPHPADWRRHGRSAGPKRNADIARLGAIGAVGFPGGAGTRDMALKLRIKRIPIWWPDGGEARV